LIEDAGRQKGHIVICNPSYVSNDGDCKKKLVDLIRDHIF